MTMTTMIGIESDAIAAVVRVYRLVASYKGNPCFEIAHRCYYEIAAFLSSLLAIRFYIRSFSPEERGQHLIAVSHQK